MNHLAVHLKLTQIINQLYAITKIILKSSFYILTRKAVFAMEYIGARVQVLIPSFEGIKPGD